MSIIDPVAFAQQLIQHPSVTPQAEGVLDTLELALKSLGFLCFRETFTEEGTAPVENLYARYGSEAPNFCYAGHLDVVPIGNKQAWSVDPFAGEIRNGYLYGRGAEDMKGAIACFTAAASRFLTENDGAFPGSISFLITMDEEGPAINGTCKMLEWLEEQGQKPDICLVGEPTNPERLGEMIKIGRRGSMNCELKIVGKQGHVAYPHLANNPVTQLVKALHRLKSEPIDKGTDYFQPSNLEVTSIDVGNPATNMIPASAEAKFNIRFNDSRPVAAIKNWIQYVCEDETEQFELCMAVTGEAFYTQPGPLTDILQQVIREVTGLTPELSTTGGTSDARFIKDYCPVVEFGATNRTAHHVDENVALETLEQLTEVYYGTLKAYFAR